MSKKNASAMKRIMSEMQELANDTSLEYAAAPTEVRRTHLWQDNLFEWHFTLRGPRGTEFERGMYHGKILLPTDYPFRPPDLVFLTPSGRWEVNNKVCLTFTGFHEESWQPAWGIRTALLGVQALMSSKADESGTGALAMPTEDREHLAEQSRTWACPHCQRANEDQLAKGHEEGISAQGTAAGAETDVLPASSTDDAIVVPTQATASGLHDGPSRATTASNAPTKDTTRLPGLGLRPVGIATAIAPSEPAPTPTQDRHAPSMVHVLESRLVTYDRMLATVDVLMGILCALLVLWILNVYK